MEEAARVSETNISQPSGAPRISIRPISQVQRTRCLDSHSPLARRALGDAVLELSSRIGKTVAQIALRWLVQKGVVVIPKARSRKHLSDNMNMFDFELTDEEMARIDAIETTKRLINPPWAEFDRS